MSSIGSLQVVTCSAAAVGHKSLSMCVRACHSEGEGEREGESERETERLPETLRERKAKN